MQVENEPKKKKITNVFFLVRGWKKIKHSLYCNSNQGKKARKNRLKAKNNLQAEDFFSYSSNLFNKKNDKPFQNEVNWKLRAVFYVLTVGSIVENLSLKYLKLYILLIFSRPLADTTNKNG